ncbi:MAG TPA: hypothetical protein VGL93_25075 [Streptosporangiaceae bacterium]
MGAGPAMAQSSGSIKEKVVGPGDLIHVTATGCNIDTPWLNSPFTGDPKAQKWTKSGDTWTGVVTVTKWGIFSPHPKTNTTVDLMCAGSGPTSIPITWDPNHKGGHPTPTSKPTKPTPTTKPTTPAKTFKVTVTPKYFHAGDTLHVAVYKCMTKPAVHSQILTGGAHWTKSGGVWKTPVKVAKGLRTGYYNFTVTCKGFNPVVFKVRYGQPNDNGSGSKPAPAKHTPNGQTKYIPNGGASTGGGSTAKSFV